MPIILDENGVVIDGHHRQKIAQSHDLPLPSETRTGFTDAEKRTLSLSLNLDRRHLNREQKRALIAESIKADPQLSDREHAKRTGASPSTAGAVREKLVSEGLVSKLDTRVGSDGVQQPASKPRPALDPADPALDAYIDPENEAHEISAPNPSTPPLPIKRKRKPIVQMAVDAGWELRKAVDSIDALRRDDRYEKTESEVIEAIAAHITYTQETIMVKVVQRDEWAEAAITELRRYGYTPIRVQAFTRADVVSEHGNRCHYCKDGNFAVIDHHIPLIDGGEHTLANARPCCIQCSDHHSRW